MSDRIQVLLLSSIYLVLVGMFFSLEGGPINWVWTPFWASVVPALYVFGALLLGLFSNSQSREVTETSDR